MDDQNEKQNFARENEMNISGAGQQKETERMATTNGMDQNSQEGNQENQEEKYQIQKANGGQMPYAEKEEKDFETEIRFLHTDGATGAEGDATHSQDPQDGGQSGQTVTNGERSQQYSCSYTPPYYVPNFTVSDSKAEEASVSADEEEKKEAKQMKALGGFVVLGVALAILLGVLGGLILAKWMDRRIASGAPTVTVTKNDGSIVVNEVVGSTGYDQLSVAEVVQLVADSVVEITTSQVQNDLFWGNFVRGGAGSGVVIDPNGYIITNNHVIDGADSVTVRLTSGVEYPATVVGGDADSDIAILKIEATELRAAVLGKSSQLKVGQGVVAIGNPLGELGGTVTDGIISALDRQVIVDGYPMTLLQTNAAINPGNSGGGLFNMAGELVGIVNAKQSDTGIEGLGFAIPIDVAWKKASDLMQYGYVTGKVILEFSVEAKTSEFNLYDGGGFWGKTYTFPAGVYVVTSQSDSLKRYDRIMSVNGITVNGISDFYGAVQNLKKGDELKLVVSRLDTSASMAQFREHTVTMTVKVTEPNA